MGTGSPRGDLLDAYKTDVGRPLCAESAHVAGRGGGPGGEQLRASGYAERVAAARAGSASAGAVAGGWGPMSVTELDGRPVEDRWPPHRRPPDHALEEVCSPSHLLGVEPGMLVANFGGGNVGEGRRGRPRRPEVRRDVGQGLRLRPGDDVDRRHFTPLRLEEMLPLLERDEMSKQEAIVLLDLARCPGSEPGGARAESIETLLHAFIPAPTSTTPIPTA